MRKKCRYTSFILPILLLMLWGIPVSGEVFIQCPCLLLDANGKPDPTKFNPAYGTAYNVATQNIECTIPGTATAPPRSIACKALTAGDGHVNMADGNDIFIFGFDDVTVIEGECVNNVCQGFNVGAACQSVSDCTSASEGLGGMPVDQVMNMVNDPMVPGGMRGAESTAPTITVKGGQEFYLSLTNVGMVERPDIFDPHTVHYHGFPDAGSVFDGEPMASIAITMGNTLTYYYNNVDPGSYMWHCHVEAAEHMQMGMLGNLYVRPQQDGTSVGGCTSKLYAYNDGDGSTCYDVAYPMTITAFDPIFHHADNSYQLVNFANMNDTYTLLNGRGYPYTVNPCGRQSAYPVQNFPSCTPAMIAQLTNALPPNPANPPGMLPGVVSQNVSGLITATHGQKILLHFPSLATSEFYTVNLLGLAMKIVGQGARQYIGPTGLTYYYNTSSITIGGGEAYDIMIDTTGATPGTYFLYTTNLNHLSNNDEDFGGMMTEIVIN
jgi:FtsP/CotA-like multicopper oxidase with cupredoxin domain